MIAATDPQEFIPGGRQQALRHPGPPDLAQSLKNNSADDLLSHKFKKVSLTEESNEWWAIRKSPNAFTERKEKLSLTREQVNNGSRSFLPPENKSHSEFLYDDSWSCKSMETNVSNKTNRRVSDVNASKLHQSKRFSLDADSKCSSNKSYLGQSGTHENVKFKSEMGYMEEELYVKGNLVVWTKGLSYNLYENARTTICSYSSVHPVKHATWSTFYCERPEFKSMENMENKDDVPLGDALHCVCIVDSQNLRVYTMDSEDFITTLPFQVLKVWNTKFGILLEKENNEQNRDIQASMFSLTHPLDEVSPMVISKQGCTNIINDEHLQVVYTLENPSICMMYDGSTGLHSVYRIRRVKQDEWIDTANKTNNATPSGFSISNKFKSHMSMIEGYKNCMPPGISPFSSRATSVASSHFPSSPAGTLSRCHTPAASPLPTGSPWLLRLSRLHSSRLTGDTMSTIPDRMNLDTTQSYNATDPAFCLDYLWSESTSMLQEGILNGPATSVYLIDDLIGQWYLCYFVLNRLQLSIVKIDFTNPNCIVFGMNRSISAKDSVAIPHLHMLAILEHTGNVVLYSGLTIVGKLHIGGVLAQHVPSPFVVRRSLKQFTSPFPRRSSLLPSSQTSSEVPRFDDHLLSPVLPTSSKNPNVLQFPLPAENYNLGGESVKTYLRGLRDSIENRVTLQYSDGSYYRVSLPQMVSTTLVENCLNVLRQILQSNATITLLTRWYATRNSPGTIELTVEKEWEMFTALLLELLGYENDQSSEGGLADTATTPSCAAKRQRQSAFGSESDWKRLQHSDTHYAVIDGVGNVLKFTKEPYRRQLKIDSDVHVNSKSILFTHIKIIQYSLHLLYEDLKLNTLCKHDLPLLASFLSKLAMDLGNKYYVMHYWRDFPDQCPIYTDSSQFSATDLKNVIQWSAITDEPTNIFGHFSRLFNGETTDSYPIVANVNVRSRNMMQLCGIYMHGVTKENVELNYDNFIKYISPPGVKSKAPDANLKVNYDVTNDLTEQKVVLLMAELGITTRDLETYPAGVNFVLHDALWRCRENPPTDWPPEAFNLLQRPDLASQAQIIESKKPYSHAKQKYTMFGQINENLPIINQVVEGNHEDGMEDVDGPLLKLRFSDDMRVSECRRWLQSSKSVSVDLVQRPDVSDHDFIEDQEKQLYAICTRTMALPVGRGMFTLRTATPVITEPLPIPHLCLTGKAPPRGSSVELTHIDTPANMNLWPLFHNGVANGLRIDPDAMNIDSTWIIFNKPRNNMETVMEHAGFLMALGLNGHLKNLAILNTFDYLVKFQEMTSVGILLGLSAANRATSNLVLTKMLGVHIETLLPPTSMEMDVPQNLQVAALFGIGLVYQGTAHRHMTEILLTEIGRPPGPEMENSVDRESYSLAAGLALGLVTLRQGGKPSGLSDLNVPDTLHYYMVGGNKRPLLGSQKDKYKVPSFQIREGSSVNLDVTAPGATLALGLMYLGTGNKAIADWMAPPQTQYLLDFVRPDFLMLRTLSRALILWNEISPDKEWIENQVPNTIRPYCMVKPSPLMDVDYEGMNQAYCNIIAGACFALGLRFAGSADEVAFATLLDYCHMFTSLTSKSIAELAGKPTIETCLNVVLLSVSMVMAGTGNLEIMRIVRFLRRRVGILSSAVVTYGSHLAIHMALGLLFLGGGRYTLSNSPASVAALICAFYPKFPTHSNDNRYHLQAFRHLYVMAVEPRLIIPKDITVGRMCYANICVIKLDGTTLNFRGPGLIPDLNTLYKVSIKDERYWPVVFERERNWDQLIKLLSSCCCIDVKPRAGCLSYTEDKLGFQSDLAHTLMKSKVVPWDPPPKAIESFSSDCVVKYFTDHFLNVHKDREYSHEEAKFKQNITRAAYDCVIKDKLSIMPVFVNLIKTVKDLNVLKSTMELWNLRMIKDFVLGNRLRSTLTNSEFILSLHHQTIMIMDEWEEEIRPLLKSYILGEPLVCPQNLQHKLTNYITFYNIPYDLEHDSEDLVQLMCKTMSMNCSSETIDKILRILDYIQ
ncbi:PREDICTED: anaphase-promoting complex subunit 1 [Nicrophorus vespilloides]|uniref:Anaphase-promoting complex subunit 1 n=1 Tax=Nicrophorus vespilloides TaxID=110193 RepID=A0ABM1N5W2_NICVS|nr:PREDICTED: anaphase-promoting complex subunit 1 [Nicrophorus vespilloides]